jgi:lipopolysaccharide assembly outer membrane protein LptD (OstA)
MALLALGCSNKPKAESPDSTDPGKKEPGPTRVINSDKVNLEQRTDDGKLLWVVHGLSSVTTAQEGGTSSTELEGVTGEIYENGSVVSTFKSMKAVANEKDKSIALAGKVSVTSLEKKATLTADTVGWDDAKKLYDARGNVKIESETYEARADRLLADSKLKKIATPNLFNK